MLNWYLQPRHWTPREGYATGDVLLNLLGDGWRVREARPAPGSGRAPVFIATLERDDEVLTVLVLDGPAARQALPVAAAPLQAPVEVA